MTAGCDEVITMRPFLIAALFLHTILGQPLPQLPLDLISLPSGFNIALYSQDTIPKARQLALSTGSSPSNPNAVIVYVGSNASPGQASFLAQFAVGGLGLVDFVTVTWEEAAASATKKISKSMKGSCYLSLTLF